MPPMSNCVRVQLEFVIEFEKNASLPMELVNETQRFIAAGFCKVIPRKLIKARYGDAWTVLGAATTLTRLRPQDVEARRKRYIKWVRETDWPEEVKKHFIDIAKKVKTHAEEKQEPDAQRRGRHHRDAGGARPRAAKEVPDVRPPRRRARRAADA